MNMTTSTKDNKSIALIKMTRSGQITLPAEVRKVLALKEGDYLEAGVIDGKIQLEPLVKINRAEAERQLEEILSRVKYTGPEPMPSVDELAGEMADIIRDMRRDNAEGSAR
jgi:antitoxin PrlF